MDFIMAQLRKLFEDNLRDSLSYIVAVLILDAISKETIMKAQHYPSIVITPKTEDHPPGPFALTARQVYRITLMILARSVNIEAYQVPSNSGTPENPTIYAISRKIREILFANKHLIDSVFEMRSMFVVNQIQVGNVSAQNITIEYAELERYTGMQNSQDSLSLPPLF